MWYPPNYLEVNDLDSFVEQAYTTLQFWLDMHTNPEAWTQEWIIDDVQHTFKSAEGILSNDYFTFDWGLAAYQMLAEETQGSYVQCSVCGSLWENGCFDCDCEDESEEIELEDMDYLVEWLQDIEAIIPDRILEQSLEKKGFPIYREALEPYTHSIEEEIILALDRYGELETNWDRLTWAREATRIYHVNGDVLRDYGDRCGLEYNMVDSVRCDGFANVFGEDEVREYLAEDE